MSDCSIAQQVWRDFCQGEVATDCGLSRLDPLILVSFDMDTIGKSFAIVSDILCMSDRFDACTFSHICGGQQGCLLVCRDTIYTSRG